MSDKILGELGRDFINRMRDWAIKITDTPGAPSSWPGDEPPPGKYRFHQTSIPPMMGRAHDTDMAIAELPARYGQAVRQFWLYERLSLRAHARHRQVSDNAFAAWVMKGHELLKPIFARQSACWHAEHEQGDKKIRVSA